MVCAAAAAKLAHEHRELEVAGKAVDFLRGAFQHASFTLTLAQASEVLQTEKAERVYPKGNRTEPKYQSILGHELCQCPDCRRERGEKVARFEFDLYGDDDFDDEDAGFDEEVLVGELEVLAGMPPEIASLLLEETARAVRNGESLEQLLERLSGQSLLPEKKSRKSRRK